jgi:hypothetical protein
VNEHERHNPVVRDFGEGKHFIVCETCGLLLWFVALEDLGIKTDDWDVPEYAGPA